jgi:hypothetical protein
VHTMRIGAGFAVEPAAIASRNGNAMEAPPTPRRKLRRLMGWNLVIIGSIYFNPIRQPQRESDQPPSLLTKPESMPVDLQITLLE